MDVGTVSGTLTFKDDLSATWNSAVSSFTAASSKLESSLNALAAKIDAVKPKTEKVRDDTDKLTQAYARLSAQLDPTAALTQKYDAAVSTLDSALKRGLITQDQYNVRLQQARDKYSATTIAARQQQTETDKLRTSYRNLVAQLDPTIARQQKYENALRTLRAALQQGIITQAQFNRQVQLAGEQFNETASRASKLGSAISGELLSRAAGFIAVGAVIDRAIALIRSFVKANIEAEESQRRVEAATSRAGNATGITAKQIFDLADAYSALTGVDDELIADAAAIATRFNRLREDVFPDVIRLALDMSAATGDQLSSAMEKTAGYVNLPVQALTKMKREGIAVSKEQSELVKRLAATNDILGAQKVVLSILEAQYGGTAAEIRDSMGGAVRTLSTAWENLLEKLGQDNFGPARDGLESIISLVEALTAKVDDLSIGWIKLSLVFEKVRPFLRAPGLQDPREVRKDVEASIKRQADLTKDLLEIYSRKGLVPKIIQDVLGIGEAHKKGAAGAREQTEQEDKLGDSLGQLRVQLQKSIDALERRADKAKAFLDAFRAGGPEGLQREQDRQAALDELLNIQNSLREKGLSLTREQASLIAKLVLDERDYNRELAVAQRAYEKIGSLSYLPVNALERQEEQLKKNMPLYLQWQEITKRTEKDLEDILDLLDGQIDGIAESFQYASASMQRALEAARAMEAYRSGQITSTERDDRLRENANPLFSDAEQELFDFANGVRDSFKTTRIQALEYQAEVERAVEAGMLSHEEGQAAISRSTDQFWSDNLGAWGQAFGMLADQFGGFFNYLSQAVSAIQQGGSFGSSVGSIVQGLGGGGTVNPSGFGGTGAAGAAAGVASVAYVWYMVYDTVDKIIKDSKTRNYGNVAELGIVNFREGITNLDKQSGELVKSIRETIQSLEDALRISVEDLAEIGIKVRNDGKHVKAYVKGELIGKFGSVDEAIGEALRLALKDSDTTLRGLSDLMREGLSSYSVPDFEGLTDFLQSLREISDLDLSPGAIQIQQTIRHLDDLFRTLERMPSSAAVLQGMTSIVTGEIDAWLSWRRAITGEQESPADIRARQEREVAMFKAEKAMRIAELKLREIDLRMEAERVRLRGRFVLGNANINNRDLENEAAYLNAKAKLVDTEGDLFAAQLTAIDLALNAIADLIAQLEAIPDIDLGSLKPPGRGVGAGGGDAGGVQSFIDDRTFDLALRVMGEYEQQVATITRQYEEQIRQTRVDSRERAQLIALRERELDLLRREQGRTTADSFTSFVNGSDQFDQIRDTAEDLIRQIEDSPFGNERKARMIGRVMAAVDAQIERMANESARGLFGSLITDLEKYGASAEVISQTRLQMEILEHTIKMANYAIEIEALRAQGKIPAQIMKVMDDAFKFLEGVDVTKWFAATGGAGTGAGGSQPLTPTGQDLRDALAERQRQEAEALAEALKRARESLKKYQHDGVDPFTRELMDVRDDFAEIRRVMGNTPEVLATFNDAIDRVVDEYLEPIAESQRDLFYGDLSTADTVDQWAKIQQERDEIMSKFAAGDLSVLDRLPEFGEQYLALAELMSPKSSQGYKGHASIWDAFLSQVQLQAPQIATSAVLGSSSTPMNVAGMSEIVRYSEMQVDRLEMVNYTNQQVLGQLQLLNGKVQYPSQGGLTGVH